jgi:hypothetical protein
LTQNFLLILLGLLGVAVLVYLVIVALVYTGNRRQTKRYRPGRPFDFVPVWFLSQPEQQARAGLAVGRGPATRELASRSQGAATRRPEQVGGASDAW